MTEAIALRLVFAAATVLLVAVFVGLEALGASEEKLVAAVIVVMCATAYLIARVVLHFGDSSRRRR